MVDYKAIVVLVPSLPPRPTENFPGNYPSSEEAEQLEELEEIERVKQIQADTRELVFTPEQTTYRVGRASRNPKKGIAAAKDNCLFQSPVMSRLQAEIEMVPKKKHLRIRDTDSMHGTYLNGKLIWGKHWQALNSGDTLTFGAQVTRAGEVFMPKHFTCDVAWEKLDSNTQTPSSDKPERRIAGYGLSTEDLIVSDDDTESVEYDKGSDDYSAYSAYSEEEYSDDSEQEDSDYEKDTDNMAIDEDLPTNPTQTEEHKYEGQGKEEFNHDPTIKTVKLPGLLSLVPENPPSRSKFSIGSLMNHTQDASSSKSLTEKGNVENAAEFKLGGNIVSTKLTAGEIGGQQAEVKVEQASSNSLDPISKIETANKAHCSNLFQEVESECESDDAPEELDTKGRTVWNSTSVPEDTKNSTEKTVQESVKPVLHPPVLQSADIEKSPSIQKTLSNLLDAVKPDLKKQDQTTTSGEAAGRSKIIPCPPQKDEFFAAMRDNQATLVNLMRDKWPKIPESTTSFSQPFPADATDGLHSSPLPWVRRCYAPLTNPSAAPQQLYVPMKNPNAQESSGSNQPMAQNARMPHLFERLLESDEAKARTERLEKLKAAVYSHQRREVSYNSWTMEDEEEDLEETYLEDEDTEMALDEAAENLFATRPAMENSYILQLEDKSKPRGFSISNLVDNQPARTTPLKPVPDRCQWAAEKFSKGSTDEDNTIFDEVAPKPSDENTDSNKPREIMSHIAPPRPNLKRTYEEAALYEDVTDDKIVQETDAVEEKIAEPVDHPMVDEDVNMREVSEEKEMYEELTPVAPVMLNETTKASEARESSKQAEPQQPPTKRARIFTTGFALGAVTGAVGVFAALVASAP